MAEENLVPRHFEILLPPAGHYTFYILSSGEAIGSPALYYLLVYNAKELMGLRGFIVL